MALTSLFIPQGPISRTNLSLANYHIVLDISPKTDLSLLVKSAPVLTMRNSDSENKYITIIPVQLPHQHLYQSDSTS